MRLAPVKSAVKPAYPCQQVTAEQPELLSRLPWRWQRCRKAAVAAGMLGAMAFTGCSSPAPAPHTSVPVNVPFFRHGEGFYSMLTPTLPPSPVGELEALRIIKDAAREYGVDFGSGLVLKDVPLPASGFGFSRSPAASSVYKRGDLELDGYDKKLGVGFEYVSGEDIRGWTDEKDPFNIYPLGSAQELRAGLDKGAVPVAVFYDPMDRKDSSSLLRAQVTDFLNWLRSQGII